MRVLEELEHKEVGGQVDVGGREAEECGQQQVLADGGRVRHQADRNAVKEHREGVLKLTRESFERVAGWSEDRFRSKLLIDNRQLETLI